MKPCPSPKCGADAAKLRKGSLGEIKGVWCTTCGFSTTTVEGWECRPEPVKPEPYTASCLESFWIKGLALDRLGQDFYGLHRDNGESDEEYRKRMLARVNMGFRGRL